MPTYGYRCEKCGSEVELFQKLAEKQPPVCPPCDVEMVQTLYATPAAFKGAGWTPKYSDGGGPSIDMAMPGKVKKRGKSS